ncbi:SRPBCC family protein [Hwanghaeella grinnelliae]|uniref:SRPBCC family protein n=1 Tax=Hwanghaeella grinnelliae TaxID=2500179 RepID=A0A3S2VQW1_9PROT|nr:SRPBCC family protein [Hwanghaeella grinnelliae]RVU38211.1 SRPBCC family protein [Hwanghaeella grinnelliae]
MRFSLLTILALSLALLVQPASAHGPTRQKVTVKTTVAASPDEVWAAIGNFQDMSWHPAVHSSTGENGNNIDATRVLTLGQEGGPTIAEVLYKYSAEKRSYSYRITDVKVETLPVTNYSSHLTVRPSGSGSEIEWRGAFYRGYPNNDPPPELNDEAAVAAVTGVYEAGMQALRERFGAGN